VSVNKADFVRLGHPPRFIDTKSFKLTNESINCEVVNNSGLLGVMEKDKDVNVGLSRRAEARPSLVISSHFNIMTSSRYLQLLNKWKSDWSFK
jgi:hypothetical protein